MASAAEAAGGARRLVLLRPRGDPAGSAPRAAGGAMAGAPVPGSRRPPSKRARGLPSAAAPDPEDPFGLHGDFTADDLEELDILASQALSQCAPAAGGPSSECAGVPHPPWRRRGPGARHPPRPSPL